MARNLIMEVGEHAEAVTFLIRDRDTKFTAAFDWMFADAGLKILRSPVRAPRANAIMERWIGSCRRECRTEALVLSLWRQSLRALIRRHNRVSASLPRCSSAPAVNVGPVDRDDRGLVGDDLNLLFRMLDARPAAAGAHRFRRQAGTRRLPHVHDNLVIQHPQPGNPALFRPLKIRMKRTRIHARIYVPGQRPS
jgi:hypothetical protein